MTKDFKCYDLIKEI